MVENVKVNIKNKIGYGAIAGFVGGVVYVLIQFLLTSMNIGTLDDIEAVSAPQQVIRMLSGMSFLILWYGS